MAVIKVKERFETFTVLIAKISRNIRKIKNQEMEEYGLRSSHVSCLYYLYTDNNLTATQLCERCEEDKATISRTLDYLEQNGYLLKENRESKRYKGRLLLTEKGISVGGRISKKINDVLGRIDLELNEQDRISFYMSLSVISESLEKISCKTEE